MGTFLLFDLKQDILAYALQRHVVNEVGTGDAEHRP
jgi:hypothetical protein